MTIGLEDGIWLRFATRGIVRIRITDSMQRQMNARLLYPYIIPIRKTGCEHDTNNPDDCPYTQRTIASFPLRFGVSGIEWILPNRVG